MVSPGISDETGPAFRGNRLEHGPRRRSKHAGARTHGDGGVMPNLLATHLCLPAPQRLLEARRRRFNTIILSAHVGKRDAPARFARKGALPQFPPRSAQALPGGRAHAATYLKTRRTNAIDLDRRARGGGASSSAW